MHVCAVNRRPSIKFLSYPLLLFPPHPSGLRRRGIFILSCFSCFSFSFSLFQFQFVSVFNFDFKIQREIMQ
ncbi:hypothetical protein EVA_14482 [gut metagenome]|uniref:Uncharacterized protein n=1 Tax=gut metagenome TaxID=749906 RepID=J9GDF4_9ZZZZ